MYNKNSKFIVGIWIIPGKVTNLKGSDTLHTVGN